MPLAGTNATPSSAQPELIAPGAGAMRRGQRFQDGDRVHDMRRRHPLMGAAVKLRFALENGAPDDGETCIGLTIAREWLYATGPQLQDLARARAHEIRNHHKAGDVEDVQEPGELGGRCDHVGSPVRRERDALQCASAAFTPDLRGVATAANIDVRQRCRPHALAADRNAQLDKNSVAR